MWTNQKEGHTIRLLVATEEEYRSYRGAIAGGIQALRPSVEVVTIGLEALEEELARFDPHMVICTLPITAVSGDWLAWVELSLDPLRPSVFYVGGRRYEQRNPTLDLLLAVVDEVRGLVERNQGAGGPPDPRVKRT